MKTITLDKALRRYNFTFEFRGNKYRVSSNGSTISNAHMGIGYGDKFRFTHRLNMILLPINEDGYLTIRKITGKEEDIHQSEIKMLNENHSS